VGPRAVLDAVVKRKSLLNGSKHFSNGNMNLILLNSVALPRTALGPTHPRIQWVPGALSLGVQRPGREADHSPPSSAEIKEGVKIYHQSPSTPSWRDAQLKHKDNFTFLYLYLKYFSIFLSNEINRKIICFTYEDLRPVPIQN
jgi:hypothetical protein